MVHNQMSVDSSKIDSLEVATLLGEDHSEILFEIIVIIFQQNSYFWEKFLYCFLLHKMLVLSSF